MRFIAPSPILRATAARFARPRVITSLCYTAAHWICQIAKGLFVVRAQFETIKQRLAVSSQLFIGTFTCFKAIKTKDIPIFLDQYLILKAVLRQGCGPWRARYRFNYNGADNRRLFFQGLFVKSGTEMYFKVGAFHTAYQ